MIYTYRHIQIFSSAILDSIPHVSDTEERVNYQRGSFKTVSLLSVFHWPEFSHMVLIYNKGDW